MLALDADGGEILLDRCPDLRIGIGRIGVERRLEAGFEAGLLHQRLGLLDVVRIRVARGVVAGQVRRVDAVGLDAGAVADLQDGRLVDGVVDRLADLDVAERAVVRHLGVHEHVVGVDQRVVVDLVGVIGVRRHVRELGGRQRVAHHVERPGLDLEEHRVVVLAGLVVDLVEVRLAGLPVGRVLDERRALALGVALQQVRACPDRLGREGRRVVAGQLLGHDRGERRREHVEEGRIGVDQVELDGGRVDDLDPRGGRRRPREDIGGADDVAEEARRDRRRVRLQVRIEDAVDRIGDVVGGHLAQDAAVLVHEVDVAVDLEGEGLAVGRDRRHPVGEERHEPGAVVVVEQRLEHQALGGPRRHVIAEGRVEPLDLAIPADRQGATLRDGRRGAGLTRGRGACRRDARAAARPRHRPTAPASSTRRTRWQRG